MLQGPWILPPKEQAALTLVPVCFCVRKGSKTKYMATKYTGKTSLLRGAGFSEYKDKPIFIRVAKSCLFSHLNVRRFIKTWLLNPSDETLCEHNRISDGGEGCERRDHSKPPSSYLSSCLDGNVCKLLFYLLTCGWINFLAPTSQSLTDSVAVAAGGICPLQQPGFQRGSPKDKPGFTQHLMRAKLPAGPVPKAGSLLMGPLWHQGATWGDSGQGCC